MDGLGLESDVFGEAVGKVNVVLSLKRCHELSEDVLVWQHILSIRVSVVCWLSLSSPNGVPTVHCIHYHGIPGRDGR